MDDEKKRRFTETVQEKRALMYRVAYGITRSEADAEDAVSGAVETTWKHLERLRDPEALPIYLMKSTVNAARGILRKRKRTVPLETVENTLAADRQDAGIADMVAGLKEKYRLPLLLKYGEDLPEKEIAQLLHIPRGTVSSRVARGLALLRMEMKEETGHDGK